MGGGWDVELALMPDPIALIHVVYPGRSRTRGPQSMLVS